MLTPDIQIDHVVFVVFLEQDEGIYKYLLFPNALSFGMLICLYLPQGASSPIFSACRN